MKPGEIAQNVSRGVFYLAIEKAAAAVSGFFYVALLMRWMGPTKYGMISLALAFTGIAALATLNFEAFLERYVAEYQALGDRDATRRALKLVLGLKLALGVAAGLVLLALVPFLERQFSMPELGMVLPVLTLTVMVDGFATAGRATLYGMQRFRAISLVAVVFHVAKTATVGILWYTRHGLVSLAVGLTVLTVGHALASIALALWAVRRAPGEVAPARPTPLLQPVLRYCIPLLGARVTFTSGQNLSKIVLGKLFDATQLGFFAYAFQTVERLVEMLYTLPSALLPSFTHLVARDERERLRDVFEQAHRLIQVAGCAVGLLVFAFARELTVLVASAMFLPAVPMLRVLALVPVFRTAQQPLTMLFQAMRRPGTVLGLALVKFVAEFGSYFVLVLPFGIAGATWSNLFGAIAAYAVALAALARLLPRGAGERTRVVVTSTLLVAVLAGLCLAASLTLPLALGVAARVAILLVGMLALIPTRLVVRYDLVKLAAVRVPHPALGRVRDVALRVVSRLIARLEPQGAA